MKGLLLWYRIYFDTSKKLDYSSALRWITAVQFVLSSCVFLRICVCQMRNLPHCPYTKFARGITLMRYSEKLLESCFVRNHCVLSLCPEKTNFTRMCDYFTTSLYIEHCYCKYERCMTTQIYCWKAITDKL